MPYLRSNREAPRAGRLAAILRATESGEEDFEALDPLFRIVEEGLNGLGDGDHFFDLLADDVVFDYVITVSGFHGTS